MGEHIPPARISAGERAKMYTRHKNFKPDPIGYFDLLIYFIAKSLSIALLVFWGGNNSKGRRRRRRRRRNRVRP